MMLDEDLKRLEFIALILVGGDTYRALFLFNGNEEDVKSWNSWEHPEWVSERLAAAVGLMIRRGLPVESMSFGNGFMPVGEKITFAISFIIGGEDNQASWSLDEVLEDSDRSKWAKIPTEFIDFARSRLE